VYEIIELFAKQKKRRLEFVFNILLNKTKYNVYKRLFIGKFAFPVSIFSKPPQEFSDS
jgi:hypothetical protein